MSKHATIAVFALTALSTGLALSRSTLAHAQAAELAVVPEVGGSEPSPPEQAAGAGPVAGAASATHEATAHPQTAHELGPRAESRASATVVLGAGHELLGRRADDGADARAVGDDEDDGYNLHGFRLGYALQVGYDEPRDDEPGSSPKEELNLRSPHHFVIGYELARRLPAGGEWLNVLLVGNVMVAGLEQSRFMPTANFLLGFELERALQFGVGLNLAPVGVKPAHMILAVGWTPRSGDLYLPVHFFFIPDVDGHHRTGMTVGVNWNS